MIQWYTFLYFSAIKHNVQTLPHSYSHGNWILDRKSVTTTKETTKFTYSIVWSENHNLIRFANVVKNLMLTHKAVVWQFSFRSCVIVFIIWSNSIKAKKKHISNRILPPENSFIDLSKLQSNTSANINPKTTMCTSLLRLSNQSQSTPKLQIIFSHHRSILIS